MSQYRLYHGRDGYLNEDVIEKDFDELMGLNDIWVKGPFPASEKMGWLNSQISLIETVKACYKQQLEIDFGFAPFYPLGATIENENDFPITVLFIGMGGSIQTGKALSQMFPKKNYQTFFLDSINPAVVSNTLEKLELTKTRIVLMSKSGSTLETNELIKIIENEKISPKHVLVITDKGTPLEKLASKSSYAVLSSPTNVGGRFSSATAFGVFPALFLENFSESKYGILNYLNNDLLKQGQFLKQQCLNLTYLLNQCSRYKGFLSIKVPKKLSNFATWIEQLIAESTGKDGKGIIPLVNAKNDEGLPRIVINDVSDTEFGKKKYLSHDRSEVIVDFDRYSVFHDMLVWQISVSLACKYLSVFPFDEPDVKKSKINTENILKKNKDIKNVIVPFTEKEINTLINNNKSGRVLYINLYINETEQIHNSLNKFIEKLSSKYNIKIVSGFGPRYLHSVGQLQKGGPKDIWSIFFYDENLINSYREKNNYKDLCDTFKAQMLGDYNALKELDINTYLINIDSNDKDSFKDLANKI